MRDLTDAELDQLATALGLTTTEPPPADPWARIRALAARHDTAYGAVLGHGLGRPHQPRRRGAA